MIGRGFNRKMEGKNETPWFMQKKAVVVLSHTFALGQRSAWVINMDNYPITEGGYSNVLSRVVVRVA